MKVEMGKNYRTRKGEAVRVICVDAKNSSYPVVALVARENGEESDERYTSDGRWSTGRTSSPDDLVEIPLHETKTPSPISMDKTYRTRNGLPVRLITVDATGVDGCAVQPIVGYVGKETAPRAWFAGGSFSNKQHTVSDYDLIEYKPEIRVQGWVNVYKHEDGRGLPMIGPSHLYESSAKHCTQEFHDGFKTIASMPIDLLVEEKYLLKLEKTE
jgi:hypothetical protein